MRPAQLFLYLLIVIIASDLLMSFGMHNRLKAADKDQDEIAIVVAALGLTDLCIATEARYTRHPALTDYVVPFMDYPGEMEHFPTGSFWIPARP
jgi:hypothetical protein